MFEWIMRKLAEHRSRREKEKTAESWRKNKAFLEIVRKMSLIPTQRESVKTHRSDKRTSSTRHKEGKGNSDRDDYPTFISTVPGVRPLVSFGRDDDGDGTSGGSSGNDGGGGSDDD